MNVGAEKVHIDAAPAKTAPAKNGRAAAPPGKKTRIGAGRTGKARSRRSASGQPKSGRTSRQFSLRSRVALLVMTAVGLTVALVSIISFFTIRTQITSNLDDNLYQQANALKIGLNNTSAINGPSFTLLLNSTGLRMAVVTSAGSSYLPVPVTVEHNGQTQTISAGAPYGQSELAVASGTLASSARTVAYDGQTYRVIAVPMQSAPGSPGLALVLATPMANTEWILHLLGLVFFLVGLGGIIVAGAAGLGVAKTALRPVQSLTVATEYIARTGDLRRIEVTGTDELARLTTSFNTMLEALARSQDHQRRLVADAGHELRTPLTSMRTNLDLLAQAMAQAEQEPERPRLSAEDRTELMADVRAQMEELSLLISDLVELSRDEHPSHAIERLDFAEIVDRAIERVQRRAPDLHYDLRLEPWYLEGDPAALERAVTNLLDNAAKWSPAGGTVSVRLTAGALEVADQGPGIDEADLGHVFERFYRSPEARTMPGSGLGLAIVRQVAENHGGRVAAARAPGSGGKPGGALLGVWLPGSAQPPQ